MGCVKNIIPINLGKIKFNGAGEEYPVHAFLIYIDNHIVLFDIGFNKRMYTNKEECLGVLKYVLDVDLTGCMSLEENLKSLNIKPKEIDYIICSHLHFDHAGGISSFINGTNIIVQKKEIEAVYNSKYSFEYSREDIIPYINNLQIIDGDLDLYGDGSLVIISTPGHSKGHQSLKIKLQDDKYMYLLGDIDLSEGKKNYRKAIKEEEASKTIIINMILSEGGDAKYCYYSHDKEYFNCIKREDKIE